MKNKEVTQNLIDDLTAQLNELDFIGAHIAAAHLNAAIEVLRNDHLHLNTKSNLD